MVQWAGLHGTSRPSRPLLPSPPRESTVIICKKCGHRNQDKDQWCASCGSYLEVSGERVEEPSPPPPPPKPPEPAPPPPPSGIVDRVRKAVGRDDKEEPAAAGWQPPGSGTTTPAGAGSGQAPAASQGGGWAPPSSGGGSSAPPAPPAQSTASGTQATAAPSPGVRPPAEGMEARRPEDAPVAQPHRKATSSAPVEIQTFETGVTCRVCGIGNEVSRHWCRRCGSALAEPVVVRTPWYRQLLPRRRAPIAGERPIGQQRTATFGSLLRTFVLTMLAVLLVGGGLAYAALPGVRQAVNGRVDRIVTDVRRQINPTYAEVRPVSTRSSSEVSGHAAQFADDLVNNDYWAADMARDPQPTLMLLFANSTDLDAALITSGAAADFARLARPKTLQVTYSDGTGEELQMKDDRTPVSYPLHARHVTSVTLKVTSVYPVGGNTQVAITEIELFHLK